MIWLAASILAVPGAALAGTVMVVAKLPETSAVVLKWNWWWVLSMRRRLIVSPPVQPLPVTAIVLAAALLVATPLFLLLTP